jgi:rhodanese-related sulfurtransferase
MDPHNAPAMTAQDAAARLEGGADGGTRPLLLDVREVWEFGNVRAEGAALLPLSQFLARYTELPQDRPLLVICQSGSRSAQATAFLLSNGWTDVVNVAGGTFAWEQAGLPVRRGPLEAGEGDL